MSDDDSGCLASAKGWNGAALDAQRLRLRRPAPADLDTIVRLAGDDSVARWTASIPHPYTTADAQAFLAQAEHARLTGAAQIVLVERILDRAVIGACSLTWEPGGVAEIATWFGRDHWGQGCATEALRRLLRLAFRNFGAERVRAAVLPGNDASARVLAKLGFKAIGHHDASLPARGRTATVADFALTRAEWLAQQAARPLLLVAAAALVDTDGRVLLTSRPPGKPLAGLWEFPGGKVHPGETPDAALVRELDEELGLDIGESCLAPLAFASHDYDTFHLLMPLFVCRIWKGAPTPREGQSLVWVRPNRLSDYPMPPADVPLVALLRDWL